MTEHDDMILIRTRRDGPQTHEPRVPILERGDCLPREEANWSTQHPGCSSIGISSPTISSTLLLLQSARVGAVKSTLTVIANAARVADIIKIKDRL